MNGLTTEELDRMEELAKAAAPGDWVYEHGPGDMDVGVPESFDVLAQNGDALCSMFTFDRKVSEANARLIPALRNAAPALIAAARENAKLRAVVEAARATHDAGVDPRNGPAGKALAELALALSALDAKENA